MSRSRRAASGFISGYLMVAVTLAVQIVMVPMATGALDGDEVGLWGFTQRLAYLFTLLDLGLLPSVSRLLMDHKDSPESLDYRRTLSAGAAATLMMCAVTVGVTLLAAFPAVAWLKIPEGLRSEALFLFMATGLTIAVSGVFRITMSMMYAWQRHDLVNYAQALGQLANLAVFWWALRSGHGVRSAWYGQAVLSAVIGLSTVLALAGMGRLKDLGRLCWPGWPAVRGVLGFGLDLFWVSLGTQMALNTQGMILIRVQGLEAAGVWDVASRPFMALSQLVWKVLDASAPGLSELIVQDNRAALGQRFRQVVMLTTIFAAVAGVGLTVLSGLLVRNWGGPKYAWPWTNDLLLGVWLFVISIYRCHCTLPILQKSIAGMRWVYVAEGTLSVGLSLVAARFWGVPGLLTVAAVTATLTSGAYGLWRTQGTFGVRLREVLGWSSVSFPIWMLGLGFGFFLSPLHITPWWLEFGLKSAVLGGLCGIVGFRYGLDPGLKEELLRRLPGPIRSIARGVLGS